jgi:hypothetical protein
MLAAFSPEKSIEICTFEYSIVRIVPRVEREEFLNVGVLVFCLVQEFLEARIEFDAARLQSFAPWLDLHSIEEHLHTVPLVCAGGANSGPIGQMPLRARFHWLVAPRSTLIQMSPVHSGLCHDPGAALEHLLDRMVRPPQLGTCLE